MTKEEFIGRAADAICAANVPGMTPSLEDLAIASEQAAAALEAVGAWDLYEGACAAEYVAKLRGDELEAGRWTGRLRKAEGR